MALTWNDLFLSGSIVDLAVSKWRGRVHIKPADLGIENSDAVDKALTLGSHRLAPAEAYEKINALGVDAHKTVDRFSLSFGFIRGARYVPQQNLAQLADKLREIRAQWDAAVDEFVANYDGIKAQMLPILEQALRDAAKTPEAARAALERLMGEYPPASVVRERFSLKWNVYAIQGAKREGASAALQTEAEAVKSIVRDMVTDLRNEVSGKLADVMQLIQKGGKLQPRSVESALAVLDHVDSVNVMGDETLAAQVKALRVALRGLEEGQRVPDATITNLEGIKQTLAADIEDAVKAAERKLTGVGQRKLKVA